MPEGDTVATIAGSLRPWLVGEEVLGVDCRWPRVVSGLVGARVGRIDTRGKHLLIGFDDDSWLRVHLRMSGSWHRYDPGERWQRSRGDLAVALTTAEHEVVCFKAPEVERIDGRALARHPVLSRLGPDLLDSDLDVEAVVARARVRSHERLGDVLLDQSIACGFGNVYKSELCFLHELHPYSDPAVLDDDLLAGIYARGAALMARNVGRSRNTTGRRSPEAWVYGRAGRPCLRCGARVRSGSRDARDRVSFWCSGCQERRTRGPRAD